MKKKIVISAFSARRGGGKTYLENILKYFPDNQNLNVTILVSKKYEIEKIPSNIHTEIITFPVDNPFFRIFWEVFVLPVYLRKNHTDVFFCPGGIIPKSGFGAWKTVTMFRNMIPFDIEQRKKYPLGYMRLRNWLLSKVMTRSMESADLVIFISKFARQFIEGYSKKGFKKTVTIPHGVSNDFRYIGRELEERPSYLPNSNYILYPSIIDVYKAQKELIEAFSILRDRGVDTPILLLVGEIYGKYGKDVKKMINDLELHKKVFIFGALPYKDMPLLYKYSDFVIFASNTENCPNILLEALASSSAILCSNKMPMPEFAGEAVEYFDSDNPISIAEKVNFLIKSPENISKLKKLAQKQSDLFHWSDASRKTWKALYDV
jgi:glycosyltransferase involved in cell wall biosynthesis